MTAMSVRTLEGSLRGEGLRVGIVASRFNELVVDRLIQGALDALRRTGVDQGDVVLVRVPGAFEIAQAARTLADAGGVDVILCLGAVIRGGTPHFEHVCSAATAGIGDLARRTDVAVIYGVLTCDTVEQALDRAGVKAGNKGADAALAGVEMATLLAQLRGGGKRGSKRT
jgi:6,7-dimethyl-8-ribityllumazine synthase